MLLVLPADAFLVHFVHFLPPVKNAILPNSVFSRIVYSPPHFCMRGIFIRVHMPDKLSAIEAAILTAYNSPKTRTALLSKPFKSHNTILKISGIWETSDAYGLAFKIIQWD